MNIFSKKLRHIKGLWFNKYYVVLDGRANSVTISKAIYNHMMRYENGNIDVIVFKSGCYNNYGFALKSEFPELFRIDPICCPLQYNEQYSKIGFRSDTPSVTAILTNYGLPIDRMVRLSVIPRRTGHGQHFYEIQRPR